MKSFENKRVQAFNLNDGGTTSVFKEKLGYTDNSVGTAQMKKIQQVVDRVNPGPVQFQKQEAPNTTGLSDQLKTGVEHLSGLSMDDVTVHYNSSAPAQLQAHAFTQGTNIHVAPGQERHVPHEAWHVVQQKQGRVTPTRQLKGKVDVNDDAGLEREADVMGEKAKGYTGTSDTPPQPTQGNPYPGTIQRRIIEPHKYFGNASEVLKVVFPETVDTRNYTREEINNFLSWIRSERVDIGSFIEVLNPTDEELILAGDYNASLMKLTLEFWKAIRDKEFKAIDSGRKDVDSERVHTGPSGIVELHEKIALVKEKLLSEQFVPTIEYKPTEEEDEDSSSSVMDVVSPETLLEEHWQRSEKDSTDETAQTLQKIGVHELEPHQIEMLFHVIKASLFNDQAIYTPKSWVEGFLPTLSSDNRKLLAASSFSGWEDRKNASQLTPDFVGKKLKSLEIQYGLSQTALVMASNFEDHRFAELKASPSIFVPVKTATISGGLGGVSAGSDKLDAVQYDGPDLSPLGQFLDFMNNHYKNEEIDASKNKLPKLTKSVTSTISGWTNSNDDTTNKFYRPGTVEAISTKPRGTGRSGTGETKVGRMGVQEELINTGTVNAGQYQGGHLIGDQVMDPAKFDLYKSWNLAPQEQDFNSPVYEGGMEKGVAKAVGKGAEAHITAEVSYPADTYKVSVLNLIKNLVGSTETVASTTVTWEDAIKYIQSKKTTLPKDVEFTTRIPGYWHAKVEDVNKKGAIAGSVTNRTEGTQILTTISPGAIYKPVNVSERYMFSIFTAKAGNALSPLPLPVKPNSKPKSKYDKADHVDVTARQLTPVVGASASPSANDMRGMTVSQINAVVKNSPLSGRIKNWLVSNPTEHNINNLTKISGVGPATLKKIKAAGWTI